MRLRLIIRDNDFTTNNGELTWWRVWPPGWMRPNKGSIWMRPDNDRLGVASTVWGGLRLFRDYEALCRRALACLEEPAHEPEAVALRAGLIDQLVIEVEP